MNKIMQVSVVLLTVVLFWFSFVYYPKLVGRYQSGNVEVANVVFNPVSASSYNFPIKTEAYTIEYEDASQTYYVFVEGTDLVTYSLNRDSAKLALKTALSLEKLCGQNVIYASSGTVEVPPKYSQSSDC